jgi:hypothetical protein
VLENLAAGDQASVELRSKAAPVEKAEIHRVLEATHRECARCDGAAAERNVIIEPRLRGRTGIISSRC